MKKFYIKLIAVSLILSCTAALTACNSSSASSAASSDGGSIGDTTSVSEPSDSSSQSSEPESKTDSSSEESKSNEENKSGETSTESTVTYEYIKDGKFTLANGNLSFKMPEGWKLASASLAYQFASDDDSDANKFNLVVSKTDSPIENVTDEQMTATYKATMEDFKLVDFQHTEIAGKKAVYMQLTGMVSQVTKQTTITQYMIQSGEDAYCFSFTQSTEDETFPDLISGVIDSLEIK